MYEIAVCARGAWKTVEINERLFSRKPPAIARGLIEQWIIEQKGQLPGGRVYVHSGNGGEPKHLATTVRIRIYSGRSNAYGPNPVAVSYLGHPD